MIVVAYFRDFVVFGLNVCLAWVVVSMLCFMVKACGLPLVRFGSAIGWFRWYCCFWVVYCASALCLFDCVCWLGLICGFRLWVF